MEGQWVEHKRLAAAGVLSPYVFHREGKRIKYFGDAWRSACTAAGLPGKLVHDFRRTAIRNLVQKEANGVWWPSRTSNPPGVVERRRRWVRFPGASAISCQP